MNKPKVIVHGDVPQDAIEAAEKMAEEMGIEEIHIGTPDKLEDVLKDSDGLQMDAARLLTKNRRTGEINIDGEMTPEMAIRLAEALGMDKGWAKIPYNGVEGDSCDCPACNARRQEQGPDLNMDAAKGIPKGRYSEKLAGPGKDVAGAPMIRLPAPSFSKKPESKYGDFKTQEAAFGAIDELLGLIRKKQSEHFEKCDALYDNLAEVKKLMEDDKPLEAIAKMRDIDKIIEELTQQKV